jgi:hypothetical protein
MKAALALIICWSGTTRAQSRDDAPQRRSPDPGDRDRDAALGRARPIHDIRPAVDPARRRLALG